MAVLAIQNPVFKPAARVITAITKANPASVTTSFDHNYVTGTIIRLFIPAGFGMVQANNLEGSIIVTSDTTFTIDIDTTNFDTFAAAATFPQSYQYAQCIPTGEINSILSASTFNVLPY